jgi:hypothetical protein
MVSQVEPTRFPGRKKVRAHPISNPELGHGGSDRDDFSGTVGSRYDPVNISTGKISPIDQVAVVQGNGSDGHEAFIRLEISRAYRGLGGGDKVVGG